VRNGVPSAAGGCGYFTSSDRASLDRGRVVKRESTRHKMFGVLDLLLDLFSFILDLERLTPVSRKGFSQ
jgi:hypothetical protein